MLETAITLFIVATILLVSMAFLVHVENLKGKRVILITLRESLDKALTAVVAKIGMSLDHFATFVVKLGWYYSVHSFLRTILQLLVSMYTYFENVFENNRKKTKALRKEKKKRQKTSHLDTLTVHKEDTALSKEKQEQILEKSLEHDH